MRKSVSLLLCFSLLSCLSLNLYSQAAENELDQVELMKQFVGTWEADLGIDTTTVLTITPINAAYHFTQEWKANGSTFFTMRGVLGFSQDKEMIIMAGPGGNGTMMIEYGKIDANNNYIGERYFGNNTHSLALYKWELTSPESFNFRAKGRGQGMDWPNDWGQGLTFKKID